MNVPNVAIDWKISIGTILTVGVLVVGLASQWARQTAATEGVTEKLRVQQQQSDLLAGSVAGAQLQLAQLSVKLEVLEDLLTEVRTELKSRQRQEYRP